MPEPPKKAGWLPWDTSQDLVTGVCCQQKRVDCPADWFPNGTPVPAHLATQAGGPRFVSQMPTCTGASTEETKHIHASTSVTTPRVCTAGGTSVGISNGEDAFANEVAWEIASDRTHQIYETASLIPVLYEVTPPCLDEPQHTATVVHRKTAVSRQLASFQKPKGSVAQERLQSYVLSLQRLSANSDTVAKVFDVFNDYMRIHLLLEHCTGGSIYERILQSQYFTEQESAVLIKHMLQSLLPFHERHLYHGTLTPDSFRFLNKSPHAPLKLIDFGIELKVHRWDSMEHVNNGPELNSPNCLQFFETCKLCFCAPEIAPSQQPKREHRSSSGSALAFLSMSADAAQQQASSSSCGVADDAQATDLLDGGLLADVIDEH